jgi:hypothetical protein
MANQLCCDHCHEPISGYYVRAASGPIFCDDVCKIAFHYGMSNCDARAAIDRAAEDDFLERRRYRHYNYYRY